MMLVIFCCLLFLIMIVYPFWPGYKEMKRGQDNDNLYIKKDYVKDPRYFGLSFRNLLEPFLGQIRELSAGQTLEIDLSKKELIILGQADKPQAFVEDRITIFSEDIILPPKSTSSKEIYAFKKLEAGEMCELRAVAIDSDGYLHQGVKIIRWIDTKGCLVVESNCDLGISASSETKLVLKGNNCIFKRLFAPSIEIGGTEEFVKDYDSSELQKYPEYNDVDYDIEKIRENSVFINNIVTHKKFVVHNSATIIGSVKAYKNMCLEENVKIWGNVFCERDLVIGNCCRITGTVFVQGCLKVGNNVVLGEKGKIKSVIVRKNIVFGRGIVIHGFVLTGGVGKTI